MIAKRIICTDAPDAYQKAPLTPYRQVTLADCKIVADHVQDDKTAQEVRPSPTSRPAVVKYSDVNLTL